jgi:hypothetical protein
MKLVVHHKGCKDSILFCGALFGWQLAVAVVVAVAGAGFIAGGGISVNAPAFLTHPTSLRLSALSSLRVKRAGTALKWQFGK